MTEQSDLAAELLADELESIRSEVAMGRTHHVLKTLQERGTAQQLVRHQYSGRYPFELLQNANDAAVGSEVRSGMRAVRFVVSDSSLIVADKGRGFGPNEVRAICGLGSSSKDPGISIGYKGLGFKSVGEITKHPQIMSDPTAFTFHEDRVRAEVQALAGVLPAGQPLPAYAFPFPLEPADLGEDAAEVDRAVADGFRTVLRLPFKEGVAREQVAADLKATLSPRILVLLDATDRLEVVGTGSDFTVERALQRGPDYEEVLLEVNTEIEQWMVFRRQIAPPDGEMVSALGDAWADVKAAHLSVGVRLDSDGRPDTDPSSRLFVYFPTQERTGLPMLVHGDFALDLDRRYVSRAPGARAYNRWMAEQLVELIATRVSPALAREFPADPASLSVLAPRDPGSDFGAEIQELYLDAMRRTQFVPCVDSSVRVPGESLLLPPTLPDHLSTVLSVFGVEEVDRLVLPAAQDEVPIVDFLSKLGADVMLPAELLERFAPPVEARSELVLSWLVDWAAKLGVPSFARLISDVQCVPTTSGAWVSPTAGVFFPRERDAPPLPETLPILIARLPEVAGLESLLREAGVQPFRWRELILGSVMPVLVSKDSDPTGSEEALGVLRTYFTAEGGNDREISSRAQSVLLEAHDEQGNRTRVPSGGLYLSREWTGHGRLEEIYGPFEKVEFLHRSPPRGDQDPEEDLAFLRWLGVRGSPRLSVARADSSNAYLIRNLERHPHSHYGIWWNDWRSTQEFLDAAECPHGHDVSYQQLYTSFGLDRFPELVDSGDRRRLKLLFEELSDGWSQTYSAAFESEFRCVHGWHAGPLVQKAPSMLALMLRQGEWVPGVAGGVEVLAPPSTLWRPVADIPGNVRRLLRVVDAELDVPASASFLHAIGMIDGARPSSHDLAEVLRRAAANWDALDTESPARRFIVEIARWAMRRLDEVLDSGGGSGHLGEVPLLARQADTHVFVARPYVAEDPSLAAVWSNELPILDADAGLRRLAQAMGLEDLADRVEITPEFGGPLEGLTREVEEHMRAAAPFLAAVAFQAAPSREDSIRRLRTLSLLVCEQLTLVHRFDGTEKRLPGRSAFLAARTEGSGSRRRRIGTVYLVAGADRYVDWYALGPMLAEFIDVAGQRDAFSLLLKADMRARFDFLSSRNLGREELRAANELLGRQDDTGFEFPGIPLGVTEGSLTGGDGEPRQTGIDSSESTQDADHGGVVDAHEVPITTTLPEIDFSSVEVQEASTNAMAVRHSQGGEGGGHRNRGTGQAIDWEDRERLSRIYGHRGESVVYETERRRLERLGADPNAVVWESQRNELADFDIKSLDDDRQVIYIEVKSTSGSDESAPFEISDAELRMALKWRSQYFIYRVTDVSSPSPRVVRFRDPLGRIANEMGAIHALSARMELSNRSPDSDSATVATR